MHHAYINQARAKVPRVPKVKQILGQKTGRKNNQSSNIIRKEVQVKKKQIPSIKGISDDCHQSNLYYFSERKGGPSGQKIKLSRSLSHANLL